MSSEEEDQCLQDVIGHTRALKLTGQQEHQHCRAEYCKETHREVPSECPQISSSLLLD